MKKNSSRLQEKLQYHLHLSVRLLGLRQWFSWRRKHLPEGGLWKCVGVFGCLEGWVGTLSVLSGGRAKMLHGLKCSRWCPQPRTLDPLPCMTAGCLLCVPEWRMCLGRSEPKTELYFTHRVFGAHFQMHKVFQEGDSCGNQGKTGFGGGGNVPKIRSPFRKIGPLMAMPPVAHELPESHSCNSLYSQLSDSRGLCSSRGASHTSRWLLK